MYARLWISRTSALTTVLVLGCFVAALFSTPAAAVASQLTLAGQRPITIGERNLTTPRLSLVVDRTTDRYYGTAPVRGKLHLYYMNGLLSDYNSQAEPTVNPDGTWSFDPEMDVIGGFDADLEVDRPERAITHGFREGAVSPSNHR